jgi:hypothetical protein
MLVLGRGAGCDGTETSYVTRTHVRRAPGERTWVEIAPPTRHREVPVLARFADALADLAKTRGELCLIGTGATPLLSNPAR